MESRHIGYWPVGLSTCRCSTVAVDANCLGQTRHMREEIDSGVFILNKVFKTYYICFIIFFSGRYYSI